LQGFGGGGDGEAVGDVVGGVVEGGGVVASLYYPSMLPLSSQIVALLALGTGVQPTGISHSGPV
jgi:hypothetical protein